MGQRGYVVLPRGVRRDLTDTRYELAEVVPPNSTSAQATAHSPVYEYWWTLGHPGLKPKHHHLIHRSENEPLWSHLADDAAHVYFFFPLDSGCRVKEVVATVKYLSPVRDQESLSERANADWQKLQTLLADAGTLAPVLSPTPGVGAAAASPVLSALSKMQIGTVAPLQRATTGT